MASTLATQHTTLAPGDPAAGAVVAVNTRPPV